jgi:hypothetical protein
MYEYTVSVCDSVLLYICGISYFCEVILNYVMYLLTLPSVICKHCSRHILRPWNQNQLNLASICGIIFIIFFKYTTFVNRHFRCIRQHYVEREIIARIY